MTQLIDYKEDLIIGICNKLQLQPSLYELAEKRYHTIANIIQNDSAFYSIELNMYAHGSFRLKTTVKPLKDNEYDLDFVVELPLNSTISPKVLYEHIYRILANDGIHNGMVEKKTRCIRVNYANEFHMDIMPGQLLNQWTKEIIVPDRELKNWYHHSNPKGFADWFEEQAKTRIIKVHERAILLDSAEPLKEQEIVTRLEPLRRAVQLIKRYRDIFCDRTGKEPVRSIVLCTLMGEITSLYSSELDIISDFCAYVLSREKQSNGRPFVVKNPVVEEVLSEKWTEDENNYRDFIYMVKSLNFAVDNLKKATINRDIVKQLQDMFGEKVTNDVLLERAELLNEARSNSSLYADAKGVLNTAGMGVAVKSNTFYGK